MNHAEFYQEYRRREWLAIDIAMKRNKLVEKVGCAVSFYSDYAVVSAIDQNMKLIENIAIDGKELDQESPEYTALMDSVYELQEMSTDDILAEAVRRGYEIVPVGDGYSTISASEPSEWLSYARGILWRRHRR